MSAEPRLAFAESQNVRQALWEGALRTKKATTARAQQAQFKTTVTLHISGFLVASSKATSAMHERARRMIEADMPAGLTLGLLQVPVSRKRDNGTHTWQCSVEVS